MLSPTPLVSLITPTFNQSEFLRETVESVLGQTFKSLEYLVIDDGSTDDTAATLEALSARVHWKKQTNRGQAITLNEAWRGASGKYLAYLSSDDVLLPSALSCLVQYLEADESVVMVYPNCDLIDPNGRVIKRGVATPFTLSEVAVGQECPVGPGALFRSSAFHQAGGWKPHLKLAPDREFWMRLALLGRIEMIPKTLALYRMHPTSISFYERDPARALEYVEVTEEFFCRPDIPSNLASRKEEALSNAWLVVARHALRAGQIRNGIKICRKAIALWPANLSVGMVTRLLRTTVSKPIRKLLWNVASVRQRKV